MTFQQSSARVTAVMSALLAACGGSGGGRGEPDDGADADASQDAGDGADGGAPTCGESGVCGRELDGDGNRIESIRVAPLAGCPSRQAVHRARDLDRRGPGLSRD